MSTIKTDDNLSKLFKHITEDNDLIYVALCVMSVFKHRTAYSDIADMSLVLDTDNFLNLVSIYGGKTITIPTKEELLKICNTVVLFYETEINGLPMQSARKKYNLPQDKTISYDLGKLRQVLSTLKVPKTI